MNAVPETQSSESPNNTQDSVERALESETPPKTSSDNIHDTQETLVVPESPPIFTQDDDEPEGEQSTPAKSENNQSTSAKVRSGRAGSDVVIDIEFDNPVDGPSNGNSTSDMFLTDFEVEEFPDEDDALLVSVAEKTEVSDVPELESSQTEVPEAIISSPSSPSSSAGNMDANFRAQEQKRQKEVESFRKFKPSDKIFPDVRCSEHNTVAFFMTPRYKPGDVLQPHPAKCVPKWDPKFVPMPFCEENIILIRFKNREHETRDEENETAPHPPPPPRRVKLWQRINEALSGFPILCTEDIENSIKYYCTLNGRLKALSYCVEQILTEDERRAFFFKAIPMMTSLVLHTPEIITCPIPILRKNVNYNISLSQKQVACLLANAFFCTFPKRRAEMDMPSINFKGLFIEEDEIALKPKAHKIRCLIHYFIRIESDMPQGVVTYTKKFFRHSNMPDWGKLDKGLTKLVPLIEGTIEDDGAGMLKVDFANCFIGGGALGRGAVQEEILFVIYPELIVSRLFTEKLNYNEAVIITGCERFSKYTGYSRNFQFDGDYQDTTMYDSKGRRCTQIVAVDALYISRPTFQYHPKHFTREINKELLLLKAFVGFSSPIPQPVAVATGKWGCGAFNGDPHLKTIIQLLAASHAGRDVAFFTFGDVACLNDVISIYDSIRDMKIKDVWNLLHQYHMLCCTTSKITRSLKEFCGQYAAGRLWEIQQQNAREQTSIKKTRDVPITHFYSVEKRRTAASPALDDTLADITTGIDKINSAQPSTSQVGKRQRERDDEEEAQILTESQIEQELLKDDNRKTGSNDFPTKDLDNSHESVKNPDDKVSSPTKSSKRPKTVLMDFYSDPAGDGDSNT